MKTKIIYCVILLSLLACDDELDNITVIPAELQTYFDLFKTEAALRGVEIDYTGMKVYYHDFSSPTQTGDSNRDKMRIRLDSSNASFQKEPQRIIFHELGHLLLDRRHDDSRMGKRELVKSFMNCCYPPKPGYETIPEMQKYYLDELFDPNTPTPDWAN